MVIDNNLYYMLYDCLVLLENYQNIQVLCRSEGRSFLNQHCGSKCVNVLGGISFLVLSVLLCSVLVLRVSALASQVQRHISSQHIKAQKILHSTDASSKCIGSKRSQ